MLSSAKRIISLLERSIRLPMTAERFGSLVEERMRLTGISIEEASQSLISTLSVENLDRLERELTRRVFSDDPVRKPSMTAAVARLTDRSRLMPYTAPWFDYWMFRLDKLVNGEPLEEKIPFVFLDVLMARADAAEGHALA
jgi:hypothetical protein